MAGQAPGFLVHFASHAAAPTVGVGFVVGDEHILTCAHVVNAALGRALFQQDKPDHDEIVTLRLPTSGGAIREARVDVWLPPRSGVDSGDIAGLIIKGERLPTGLEPARLGREPTSEGEVRLFGHLSEAHRPAGDWVSCRLRPRKGSRLLQLKSDSGVKWRMQLGDSGAPVVDRASGAVVAMLKAGTDDERHPDSYAIGATTLREAWDEVLGVPPQNPYKALVAFDEKDHEVFVGREDDVARLEKVVQHDSLVLVTGPAGVGKSSLVQAGLLPALRKSGLWTVACCHPGSMPFQKLAAALFRAEDVIKPGVKALRQRAAEISGGGLADLAATIRIARRQRLLLVVDQLEELFTAGHEPVVVQEFLESILSLSISRQGVPVATVVATVRADFYDRLSAYPDTSPWLRGRLVTISPLGATALRRVVREPARQHNVDFEPGLVDRIVREAHAEPGALPLLGFTLSELWPRQRRRVLTYEAYEAIGGLEGSLRKHAETVITTMIEKGTSETALRGALLSLLSRTDERRPANRRLCPVGELPTDQQAVIETLVGARLVTVDTNRAGQRVAELAHESLVHTWPRLVQLAKEDAAFVRWRSEVEQWRAKGYGLLPEPMIAEARRWCDERQRETESIRDLVERSEAERRRQVREPEQFKDAVRGASSAGVVVFSPDGTRVATAGHDGTGRIFDAASGAELARLAHDGPVVAVAFSPDGTRVATVGHDGTGRIFDAASGAKLVSYEASTAIEAVEAKPVDFSVESRLRWVHRRSGLTWEQIARLFGVSRRAVHSWVAGGRISAANSEHLEFIVRNLQRLPDADPERTRERLISSSGGVPSLFDEIRSRKISGVAVEDTLSVRELLGMGEWTEDSGR